MSPLERAVVARVMLITALEQHGLKEQKALGLGAARMLRRAIRRF